MTDVSQHNEVEMGSERSFGIVFAVVFFIIGAWPLLSSGGFRWWALAISLVFLVVSFVKPEILGPLNRLWFRFGMLLGKIVAPIVMGIIFVLTVIPIGVIRRMVKPDPLGQKLDPDRTSYWIERESAPEKSSMKRQF